MPRFDRFSSPARARVANTALAAALLAMLAACSGKPAPATGGPATSAAVGAGAASETVAAAATPTTVFEVPYYTVGAGDSIGKIAAKLGVPAQKLIDANGIAKPDKIQVGQKLRVPVGGAAAKAAGVAGSGSTTTTTAG